MSGKANKNENCSLNGSELTALATSIAIVLSEKCSERDLLILCAFFTQISDSIKRIILQDDLINKNFKL
ncbi:hypothetical protein [Scatolibacter rhodanostii]|uniref:hypothetical protein n=1 Tax=Scatolibacter rhodanostii TaxID=2014781 RepID=UPI000C0854A8|nr:hypothetical protein [Scatolibacter rhodanostii]